MNMIKKMNMMIIYIFKFIGIFSAFFFFYVIKYVYFTAFTFQFIKFFPPLFAKFIAFAYFVAILFFPISPIINFMFNIFKKFYIQIFLITLPNLIFSYFINFITIFTYVKKHMIIYYDIKEKAFNESIARRTLLRFFVPFIFIKSIFSYIYQLMYYKSFICSLRRYNRTRFGYIHFNIFYFFISPAFASSFAHYSVIFIIKLFAISFYFFKNYDCFLVFIHLLFENITFLPFSKIFHFNSNSPNNLNNDSSTEVFEKSPQVSKTFVPESITSCIRRFVSRIDWNAFKPELTKPRSRSAFYDITPQYISSNFKRYQHLHTHVFSLFDYFKSGLRPQEETFGNLPQSSTPKEVIYYKSEATFGGNIKVFFKSFRGTFYPCHSAISHLNYVFKNGLINTVLELDSKQNIKGYTDKTVLYQIDLELESKRRQAVIIHLPEVVSEFASMQNKLRIQSSRDQEQNRYLARILFLNRSSEFFARDLTDSGYAPDYFSSNYEILRENYDGLRYFTETNIPELHFFLVAREDSFFLNFVAWHRSLDHGLPDGQAISYSNRISFIKLLKSVSVPDDYYLDSLSKEEKRSVLGKVFLPKRDHQLADALVSYYKFVFYEKEATDPKNYINYPSFKSDQISDFKLESETISNLSPREIEVLTLDRNPADVIFHQAMLGRIIDLGIPNDPSVPEAPYHPSGIQPRSEGITPSEAGGNDKLILSQEVSNKFKQSQFQPHIKQFISIAQKQTSSPSVKNFSSCLNDQVSSSTSKLIQNYYLNKKPKK